MDHLDLKTLPGLIKSRLGLIIGPSASLYTGVLNDLNSYIARSLKLEPARTAVETGDRALERSGGTSAELLQTIRDFYAEKPAAPAISRLAKIDWAAVLSFCLDAPFETQLRLAADAQPYSPHIAVITDPASGFPPSSIPVFKCVGALHESSFACSTDTLARRRPKWRTALHVFRDRVKAAPILCVGMTDVEALFIDLLGELVADPRLAPTALLFLSDDPICQNPTVNRIVRDSLRTFQIPLTVGEFAAASLTAAETSRTPLFAPSVTADALDRIEACSDVLAYVNAHLEPKTRVDERVRLLDLLFSPELPNWDPFGHALDLPRTLGTGLCNDVVREVSRTDSKERFTAHVVVGSASSGKTVLLKRLAYDLAKRGERVIWLRKAMYGDSLRSLKTAFGAITSLEGFDRRRKAVVVADDPYGANSVRLRDVIDAGYDADVRVHFVIAVRASDWERSEHLSLLGDALVVAEERLADELDEAEWSTLPAYLAKLGTYPSSNAATIALRDVGNRLARDTLSILYWMLPQTRPIISGSITDEYIRLGDPGSFRDAVHKMTTRAGEMVKRAYDFVSVGTRFGAPVPIEILVAALGVSYGEWVEVASEKQETWGLLYSDESPDGMTVLYRPRNEIVARLVATFLNGGTVRRSGEVRVMRDLLGACTGSTSIYRSFCVTALVPNDRLEDLEFDEGLSLYDAAISALPQADRTLLHHKGLWIKNRGRDPQLASVVLREALAAPPLPYSERQELDEHIHTSLAAAELDAIREGKVDVATGKERVLHHLDRARSESFFNPSSVHVQANLLVRLAERLRTDSPADFMTLTARAVAEIDRTLLMMDSTAGIDARHMKDAEMLKSARREIVSVVGPIDVLLEDAKRQWETAQRQDGFVLVAQRYCGEAIASNKGGRLKTAFERCQEILATIAREDVAPAWELKESILLLYYYWNVKRRQMTGGDVDIDWRLIYEYAEQVAAAQRGTQQSMLYRYLAAIALTHLGRWGEAAAIFSYLRQGTVPKRLLFTPRDYLLNPRGTAKRVQGLIRGRAPHRTLYVEELRTDFLIDEADKWPVEGAIAHAVIRFALAGPRAMSMADEAR